MAVFGVGDSTGGGITGCATINGMCSIFGSLEAQE